MNKKERKEIQNMKLMVEGFGEITKICCSGSVLDDPEGYEGRYNKIIEILQYVEDNLK